LQMKGRLLAEGFPGVYLPGLWLRHHQPEAFGRSALRALTGGDGMWTWDATGLWRYPERGNSKAYTGNGRAPDTAAEDYHQVIQAVRRQAAEARRNPNAVVPPPLPRRPIP